MLITKNHKSFYSLNFYKVLLLIGVLIISSCAGKKNALSIEEVETGDSCNFYNSNKKAPLWVCGYPIEGLPFSAVGVVEKSKAGLSFMRQQAAADGRVQLAQEMQIEVQSMIKTFVESTGAGDAETVDKVSTDVTKLITSETLRGSRIIRTATGPDGALYVLIGMDEQTARSEVNDAISGSYKNDDAAWQILRAQSTQEELSREISEQPFTPPAPPENPAPPVPNQ